VPIALLDFVLQTISEGKRLMVGMPARSPGKGMSFWMRPEMSRWNKAKKIVMEKGGAITFEMLKQLLLELMKNAVFGKSA